MLRIIQNRAAASAKTYYSAAAYYSEGQELAGVWGGRTAARLGLVGTIDQQDFDALCDNRHPQTAARLTARTKHNRSVGYDFNFHVPKGVSLAYALGGDERILAAFQDSLHETMNDIELDAQTRIRTGGRQEDRRTGNLVWGEFIHKTARPVNGLPDPHLHAHCFVFNVTYDAAENRYKAVQFRYLKQDAGYYEALLHARLARRVALLGYPIERQGRNWDIASVPEALRDRFSRRRDQIEALARAKGITDDAEKSALGARSRERKQRHYAMPELRGMWLAQAAAGAQLYGRPPQPISAAELPERGEEAVELAVAHCFERRAVVPERQVTAEALRRGIGESSAESVLAALKDCPLIVRRVAGRRLATTSEAIAEEQSVIRRVKQGKGATTPLNSTWRIARDWLSGEQRRAVRKLLTSSDAVQVLHGGAGTGKTALMQEARDGIEAGGSRLFTFAPSAAASRGVLRDEGFGEATTVAELLVNEQLQQQAAGQAWWIDEAGLLSTRQLRQTLELAHSLHARVILAGDWRQHASVERGGLLRQVVRQSGIAAAELGSIRRQHGTYRAAVKAVADGDVRTGFKLLDRLGWIKELPDESRNVRIATDFVGAQRTGQTCLVVAPTHAEANHLTAAIRAELQRAGLLGETTVAASRLTPLHLTLSERRDAAFYRPGDLIEFHQDARGHRKGDRMVIQGQPQRELLDQADRFSVYRPELFELAAGERVRFTANVKTACGQHRINNGATYQVAGFTRRGDLMLDNGWVVSRGVVHLDYGYVTTSHASQGKTVDRVLLAESSESFPAAGAEQFYVSISRGRKQATVYTNDKRGLLQAVEESQTGLTAGELVSQPMNSHWSPPAGDRANVNHIVQQRRVLHGAG